MVEWKEYNWTKNYLSTWFYGKMQKHSLNKIRLCFCLGLNTSLFTATKEFFSAHTSISYWQFEAIYTDKDSRGSGSVQLKTNHPPLSRTCSRFPPNGYTNTLFKIICPSETDLDGIKDYFLHGKDLFKIKNKKK